MGIMGVMPPWHRGTVVRHVGDASLLRLAPTSTHQHQLQQGALRVGVDVGYIRLGVAPWCMLMVVLAGSHASGPRVLVCRPSQRPQQIQR